MNRIDRLSAMLIQLQSKRVVKGSEMADRFGISLRTVYRDIRSLEEAGVPIGAEAGVGYYLMEHYHLPPVSFTTIEATALLFAEKLMNQMSDECIRDNFVSALYKIKAVLKPSEKDYLEKLQNQIAVYNMNSKGENFSRLFLNEIQQSLANKVVIEITYQTRFSSELPSVRQVEPIGLCNYQARWHLIAWCRLRNDYRDFRLDRIDELRLTNEKFDASRHPSIDEYMKTLQPFQGEPNIVIKIRNDQAKYLGESKYWYGFVSQEECGEQLTMHFANQELKGFAAWLLNCGCQVVVEKPDELSQILRQWVETMANFYLDKKH